MANKLSEETIELMFRHYADQQSYAYVSRKSGISERTVRRYCEKLNWPKRLAELRIIREGKLNDNIATMQSRHAMLGMLLQSRGAKTINTMKQIKDEQTAVRAVETGIRIEREARGEPVATIDNRITLELVGSNGEKEKSEKSKSDEDKSSD